ncbi:MAG TPA: GNAT family N-acetyltransferase [Myxococcales bacterium]|jgi:ribosomal-protein-alanine N-acetyltransferase
MLAPAPAPVPVLRTARLTVRLAAVEDAARIAAYYGRNRAHLAPFEPPRAPEFFTPEFWAERAIAWRRERELDQSCRLFLFQDGEPIGVAGLAPIQRGPFQCASLGYSVDAGREGQGLMSEALRAVIRCAFEDLKLHRLQANHLPENVRSAALLARLGFVREGYAKEYLFIGGAWRDHVLNSLTNPAPTTP